MMYSHKYSFKLCSWVLCNHMFQNFHVELIPRAAGHGYQNIWSRGSSGSIVSDYGLDNRVSIPDRGRGFFFQAPASRPALGPTQPPIQWVPGVLSAVVKRSWGVTLTTHLHLVPRLSMSRSYTSSPPMCQNGIYSGTAFYFYQNMQVVIFERGCVIIGMCSPVTFVNEQQAIVSIIIHIITVLFVLC
jgi:hypothetical protein